ncbi:hypothetical protein IMZ48_44755 [Candidatus Bathyarchaeota archaeon]|nr:hypothetical protein [Candidatus Bathyarchaeota archaeon]
MSESKGNSTGLNLLTDASQQPRPVFTTAGTVWNPESAKPMRAPVRRGRASATPLGSPLGDQWTFLSQHDGGGLFHPGQAPPVLPHYSPLQQNNDRAVSPSPPLSDHGGNPSSSNMASIEAGVGRSPIQPGGAAMTPHGSQSDKASLKLEGDEDDDVPDDNDYGFARMLPMKSLVNLASYKNPVQQKAQNLLRGNSNSG